MVRRSGSGGAAENTGGDERMEGFGPVTSLEPDAPETAPEGADPQAGQVLHRPGDHDQPTPGGGD